MERIIDINAVDITEELGIKYPAARVAAMMATTVLGGMGAAYVAEAIYFAFIALTGYAFISFLIALLTFVIAFIASINASLRISHFVGSGKPMKYISNAIDYVRNWRK